MSEENREGHVISNADFKCTQSGDQLTIVLYTGPGGAVVIPREIAGVRVAVIGAGVFSAPPDGTTIRVPGYGKYTYGERASLTSIIIPDTIISIGEQAFAGCDVVSLTIPASVERIGDKAFLACTMLKKLTIPASVTRLEDGTFRHCVSLQRVFFGGQPPVCSPSLLKDARNMIVYYIPGTRGWGATFADRPTAPCGLEQHKHAHGCMKCEHVSSVKMPPDGPANPRLNIMPELRSNVEACMQKYSEPRGVEHFRHVTFLASRLYDELESVHELPPRYRAILWVASMLHDIGTATTGPSPEHGWRSGAMILKSVGLLPCRADLMTLNEVATVAALHRADDTVTPQNPLGFVRPVIADLWQEYGIPRGMRILAGILRIADGLDHSLSQSVANLNVNGATICIVSEGDASGNILRAQKKSGLLSHLLGQEWHLEREDSARRSREVL